MTQRLKQWELQDKRINQNTSLEMLLDYSLFPTYTTKVQYIREQNTKYYNSTISHYNITLQY